MPRFYFLRPGALLVLLASASAARAQSVGIGTTSPDPSAVLELRSTSQGLLPPRLSQTQRNAIARPAAGLIIFNTTSGALNTWDGAQWLAGLLDTTAPPFNDTPALFGSTGSAQTYTVPAGVTSLRLDIAGAAGGASAATSTDWAPGGRVQATLAVAPGQVLTLYVGGQGGYGPAGGYNGGGSGGRNSDNTYAAGGGGATDIRLGGTALSNRVLVAAGGGGSVGGSRGGAGGGLRGGAGNNASGLLGSTNAGGGTQTGGGAGYRAGALGQGGSGGDFSGSTGRSGDGGGGGYYGGGSGQGELNAFGNSPPASGAGGSSYASPEASDVTHTSGYQQGDGYVRLAPARANGPAPILDARNITGVIRNQSSLQNWASFNIDGTGTANLLQATTAVWVDAAGANSGTLASSLRFGGAAGGEGLGSKRTSGGNQAGLDFYTASTSRLSISSTGNVGIGTSLPTARLDVAGGVRLRGLAGAGSLLATDADGNLSTVARATLSDNLGNHTATQNLNLATYQLVGNGGSQGLSLGNNGVVSLTAADGDKLYFSTEGTNGAKIGYAANGLATYVGPPAYRTKTDAEAYHSWLISGPNNYEEQLRLTRNGLGIKTATPATALDVNGNLRLAVRLCPVDQATPYALGRADIAYSIFKVQNAAFAPSLVLPPAGGEQVEGQELTILTTASNATSVSGTNTDNGAAVSLASINSSGLHAVRYVWATAQNGTGYRVRVP